MNKADLKKAAKRDPIMTIWAGRGDKVRFKTPVDYGHGLLWCAQHALDKGLVPETIYIVEEVRVGGCSSEVRLQGIAGLWNTVLFVNVKIDKEKAAARELLFRGHIRT